MTIIEFLLDRIAEDEAAARDASEYGASWHWDSGFGALCNDPECSYGMLLTDDGPTVIMEVHAYDVHEGWQGAAHIALHDPARVLAECAAKRAIIAAAMDIGDDGRYSAVLRQLATVYADHPDYE